MKFLPSQLVYLLGEHETRRNLRALFSFAALLSASVAGLSVLFHIIMLYEGQAHSWLTGLYWTLTVMSTLGFGDITFRSDLGRLFSIIVLLYGIVMLLIVAPFTFIRFFYAPWLEAQIRIQAPRKVRDQLAGHVVICRYDEIARGLIERLDELDVPYVVLEPDPELAASYHAEGISVVAGAPDDKQTFQAVRAGEARLLFANLSDTANSNATLTAHEIAPALPVIALADLIDSVDVLEMSGATEVIPLKHRLAQQLASHVTTGAHVAHRIGRFEGLEIAEFPIHGTRLPGRTIRDTRLREITGLNVVAVWERGHLLPAGPNTVLSLHSVPVVLGTEDQISELEALFVIYQSPDAPVLVIGGGKVGRAVCQTLRGQGARVTVLEIDPTFEPKLTQIADRVVIGDAANLQTVKRAGIDEARSVVLTTNDDATNIFLSLYFRKLNADVHIVSRITNRRNLEAIHRAGADFVLSHTSLAVQIAAALIRDHALIVIGEGTELFVEPVPTRWVGRDLAESEIGAKTGLNVVAIRENGNIIANPTASTRLTAECDLYMIGTALQRQTFRSLKE